MGFFQPGRSTRKRTPRGVVPRRATWNRTFDNHETENRVKRQKVVETISTEKDYGGETRDRGPILVRFPVEILQSVFCELPVEDLANIQLVSRHFAHSLRWSPYLGLKIVHRYVSFSDDTGMAMLDRKVLNYRFVTIDILRQVWFDTVVDKNAQSDNTTSSTDIVMNSQEICGTANDPENDNNHNTNNNTDFTSVPSTDFTTDSGANVGSSLDESQETPKKIDFPSCYYQAPFDDKKLKLIQFLAQKNMHFADPGYAVYNALSSDTSDEDELLKIVDIIINNSETKEIKTFAPFTLALGGLRFQLANKILTFLPSDLLVENSGQVWQFALETKNSEIIEYLLLSDLAPHLTI